jgi:hypothetical protein
MSIKTYIAEAERRYHFRVKTVVPLTDKEMDRIELAVAKYQPIEVGRPKKTMLQKHPLDFRDIENSEVYIVDMVLALPASPYVLQQDIRQNLNIPEKYVVVRGDNEPIEIEGERLAALAEIEAEAKKRGLKPAPVLGDPDYKEVESEVGTIYYGDGYNSAFLAYLTKVRSERMETRVDPPNPLFKWLDLPKDGGEPKQDPTNFNAHLKKVEKAAAEAKVPSESVQGNIDTDQQTVERAFVDAKGNRVVIRRKVKGVRGGVSA